MTNQDDQDGGAEFFRPMLGLAALAAVGGLAAWWLKGHVTNARTAHMLMLIAFGSGPVCLAWLVGAWFLRPRGR